MKKRRTFRFSDDTMKKLDAVVEFEEENVKKIGILGVKYDRTSMLEILIEKAYELIQEGKSIQDV